MTKSRKYSTLVPCTSAGLLVAFVISGAVEARESDCIDCASQSLLTGTLATGVPVPTNPPIPEFNEAEGICIVKDVAGAVDGGLMPEVFLNVERRFCADDLRRMLGRACWPLAPAVAMLDSHEGPDGW